MVQKKKKYIFGSAFGLLKKRKGQIGYGMNVKEYDSANARNGSCLQRKRKTWET